MMASPKTEECPIAMEGLLPQRAYQPPTPAAPTSSRASSHSRNLSIDTRSAAAFQRPSLVTKTPSTGRSLSSSSGGIMSAASVCSERSSATTMVSNDSLYSPSEVRAMADELDLAHRSGEFPSTKFLNHNPQITVDDHRRLLDLREANSSKSPAAAAAVRVATTRDIKERDAELEGRFERERVMRHVDNCIRNAQEEERLYRMMQSALSQSPHTASKMDVQNITEDLSQVEDRITSGMGDIANDMEELFTSGLSQNGEHLFQRIANHQDQNQADLFQHIASKQDLEHIASKQDLEHIASKQDVFHHVASKQDVKQVIQAVENVDRGCDILHRDLTDASNSLHNDIGEVDSHVASVSRQIQDLIDSTRNIENMAMQMQSMDALITQLPQIITAIVHQSVQQSLEAQENVQARLWHSQPQAIDSRAQLQSRHGWSRFFSISRKKLPAPQISQQSVNRSNRLVFFESSTQSSSLQRLTSSGSETTDPFSLNSRGSVWRRGLDRVMAKFRRETLEVADARPDDGGSHNLPLVFYDNTLRT